MLSFFKGRVVDVASEGSPRCSQPVPRANLSQICPTPQNKKFTKKITIQESIRKNVPTSKPGFWQVLGFADASTRLSSNDLKFQEEVSIQQGAGYNSRGVPQNSWPSRWRDQATIFGGSTATFGDILEKYRSWVPGWILGTLVSQSRLGWESGDPINFMMNRKNKWVPRINKFANGEIWGNRTEMESLQISLLNRASPR